MSRKMRPKSPPGLLLFVLLLLMLSQVPGGDFQRLFRDMLVWGQVLRSVSFQDESRTIAPTDLLLCFSLLVYSAGYYRLMGMVKQLFPPDPRLTKQRPWWGFAGLLGSVQEPAAPQ